jgi:ribosomal protein L35AE/L33A
MIPQIKETKDDPYNCPSLLARGIFWVMDREGKPMHSTVMSLHHRDRD